MEHLQPVAVKAATTTDQGVFSALLSTYDVDRVGERVMPGAFKATIEAWQQSGKMIPLHWEHSSRPEDIIGYLDPKAMEETKGGLYVEGKLDLQDSETARQVWRSMKNNTVGLSFGYLVQQHQDQADGTKDLLALDLFEGTLTAKPVNAGTRVLSMKSVEELVQESGAEVLIVDPDSLFIKADPEVEIPEPEAETKASDSSWDGSASRFTDEQYARSCILDRAKCGGDASKMTAKERYSLPIREPNGTLNKAACHAAASRLNQVDACDAAKSAAKNALRRAYSQIGEDAPDSLKDLGDVIPESSKEDEDATGEEPRRGQPRAQDPLRDEVMREITEMRLHHSRTFNPLSEE